MKIKETLSDIWDDIGDDAFILFVIVAFVGFVAVLLLQPKEQMQISGYLAGKEYEPSSVSTGIGSGVGADGKPTTIVTTSTESEKWTVVLDVEGSYKSYKVSPNVYYSLEEKTYVSLSCLRGKWIPLVSCE